jgi:DNA polymerase III subunit delta'
MSWNIIGHEWAVEYLRRSIGNGRDAQSYLISGPAGIGKALLALRIAQTLNCEQAGAEPCLTCRECRRIERGNHPDVRIAGMASQAAGLRADEAARQKELKIDTVRAWQQDIALRPYEGRRRVFILHDAERLTVEASNAMLKTLEEPPAYATLILVANSADLLQTIVSRCQLIRLRPLPRRQIAAVLRERYALAEADAAMLAAWSDGRIGWALRMLDAPDERERRAQHLQALRELATQPGGLAFRWAEERAREYRSGEQARVLEWLDLWQSWWRDILLIAADCPEFISNIDCRQDIEAAARHYSIDAVYQFINRINSAARQLRENVNPQLALENLILHLPGRN